MIDFRRIVTEEREKQGLDRNELARETQQSYNNVYEFETVYSGKDTSIYFVDLYCIGLRIGFSIGENVGITDDEYTHESFRHFITWAISYNKVCQRDIAKAVGVSEAKLSSFLNDKQGIRLELADKICKYFGLTYVFGEGWNLGSR